MNVNSMHQLVGAIQKNPQAVGEAVSAGVGTGFENMLQQASQKPANSTADKQAKPADKKPAAEQKQNSDNKANAANDSKPAAAQKGETVQNAQGTQDAQENQQALAAALVTSQPLPVVQVIAVEAETVPVQTAQVVNAEAVAAVDVNAGQVMPQTEQAAVQQAVVQTGLAGAQAQVEAGPQTAAVPVEQAAVQAEVGPQQNVQATVQTAGQQVAEAQVQPELKPQTVEGGNLADAQAQTEEGSDEAAAALQTPIFGDGEAVPVKVMEAETLDPQADDAAEQLAQKINQALNQGDSRVTLNLTPANLGNLTVEITRLADGTLNVILSAVTEKAAGLLEKHSGTLQNLLAMNMPGNVRVEVENRLPEEAPQQFMNPDQQEQNSQQQPDEQQRRNSEDQAAAQNNFMQQLRLGLIDLSEQ